MVSIVPGIKNENVFNIAVCELGGFLPIRGDHEFYLLVYILSNGSTYGRTFDQVHTTNKALGNI